MDNTAVGVVIGITTKGFGVLNGNIKTLRAFSDRLKKAGADVKSLNRNIAAIKVLNARVSLNTGNIKNEISNLQSKIAGAASVALPIKFAVDDEAAFANVKKYVDDSKENLNRLKDEMRALSASLGDSFVNIADIASAGGKINLKGDELIKYTKLLATGAVAFEMSSDELSKASNNMKVGFKLDDINKLGGFFDRVNLLDNKVSNAGAADILTATSLTAGTANMLGLNEHEASALAASLLSTGRQTSVVSNALNTLYNKLASIDKQGKSFHDALNTIGLDGDYLKTAIGKNAAEGISMFLERIALAPKELQAGLLYDLMGGNFNDEIAGLVSNIKEFKKTMDYVKDDDYKGSMNKELEVKLETSKSSIQRLIQSWRNLASVIGEMFLPAINLITNGLSLLAQKIQALINFSPLISKMIFGFVGGVLAFSVIAPVFKILLWSFSIVWSQVKIVTQGFLFFSKALKLSTALMIKNTIATKAEAFCKGLLSLINLKNIKIGAALYMQDLKNLGLKIKNIAITLAQISVKKAYAAVLWLVGLRLKALNTIARIYNFTTKALIASTALAKGSFIAFAGVFNLIKLSMLAGAGAAKIFKLALIGTGIGAIIVGLGFLASYLIENWQEVKAFFERIWDKVRPYFEATANFFRTIFDPIIEWWNDTFGGFFDWIGEKLSWVGNVFKSIGSFFGIGDLDLGLNKDTGSSSAGTFNNALGGGGFETLLNNTSGPQAYTPSSQSINISFNGDFLLNSENGKFNMADFEKQLTQSVKKALKVDSFNAKNRSIGD